MQEVTTWMREKGINTLEWADSEEWRKKNKILVTEIRENIDTLY